MNCFDKNGDLPIHKACKKSEFQIAEFLIQNGANLAQKNKVTWFLIFSQTKMATSLPKSTKSLT